MCITWSIVTCVCKQLPHLFSNCVSILTINLTRLNSCTLHPSDTSSPRKITLRLYTYLEYFECSNTSTYLGRATTHWLTFYDNGCQVPGVRFFSKPVSGQHSPVYCLILPVEMFNIVGEQERPNLGFARDVGAA